MLYKTPGWRQTASQEASGSTISTSHDSYYPPVPQCLGLRSDTLCSDRPSSRPASNDREGLSLSGSERAGASHAFVAAPPGMRGFRHGRRWFGHASGAHRVDALELAIDGEGQLEGIQTLAQASQFGEFRGAGSLASQHPLEGGLGAVIMAAGLRADTLFADELHR